MTGAAVPIDYAGSAPTAWAAQLTWWSPTDAVQFALAALGLGRVALEEILPGRRHISSQEARK